MALTDAAGSEHELWTVEFRSREVGRETIQVCYAWSAHGIWNNPKEPRVEFAGEQMLFKLQVATTLAGEPLPGQNGPIERFLAEFLPELSKHLPAAPTAE